MTTPPSDDMLNTVWNDLVASQSEPAADGRDRLDPADARLLHSIHRAANAIQPGPDFRDGLWAELSQGPAIGTCVPESVTASKAHPKVNAMRPIPRLAPSSHRWTSPVATIAAALVIALVGYGALSLSGANPGRINLDLNDVPNASAQGQGQEMATNPVVGTWAWLTDFTKTTSSLPIFETMTLDAGGGVTATAFGDWTGHGVWSASGDSYSVHFSVLTTQEALKRQGFDLSIPPDYGQRSYVPSILVWSTTFMLTEDGNEWHNISTEVTYGVQPTSFTVGSNDPQFFVLSDYPSDSALNDDPPLVRRLDSIIQSAPTISAADAGIDSSGPSMSSGATASSATMSSRPSTPTEDADLPTPTVQITVTPLPTGTTVPLPSPSS